MTTSQRAALGDMMSAILACNCATPAMRLRAQVLRIRLGFGASLGSIFG
ncbi:hypothetical protein ACQVP2_27365 [Methylobacterium aquaticum]